MKKLTCSHKELRHMLEPDSESPPRFADVDTAAFDDLSDNHELSQDSRSPVNYSVRSLMIATALIALATMLLKYTHLFGLLCIFALIVVISLLMKRVQHPSTDAVARGLWGIVMPVLCILYDPGFLHRPWYGFYEPTSSFDLRTVWDDPKALLLLPPILWQVVGMSAWLLMSHRLRPNPFLGGFFLFGSVLAGLIGFCILPLSLIGLIFVGLGIVGFTPFLTSRHYFLTVVAVLDGSCVNGIRRSKRSVEPSSSKDSFLVVAGFVSAVFVSLCTSALGGRLIGFGFYELIDAANIFQPFF